MPQLNAVYPCLTPSTRIVSREGESIIANITNGKWMRVDDETLICLSHRTYKAAVDSLLTIVTRQEACEFIALLVENEFIDFSVGNQRCPEMRFEVVNAYLNVTDYCNLTCPHCYFGSSPGLSHGLSHEAMCEVVTRLQLAGISHLVIAGGEPLTRPNIEELLVHIHETGFETVTLLTNGTIHSKALASTIVRCTTGVHVSIDGPDEASNAILRGSGNFDRAVRFVETLHTAGAKNVQIITTITSQNLSRMHEMRDLCNRLGIEFGTTIFAEAGRGCQHADLAPNHRDLINFFLGEVERVMSGQLTKAAIPLEVDAGVSCGAGTIMVSLDCRGNIFPCHFFHQPELLIGNILENPDLKQLMEISPVAIKVRQSTVEHRKCHGCSVEYFCKGGCLAHAVFAHPNSSDPWTERDCLCQVHRTVLNKQLWPSSSR